MSELDFHPIIDEVNLNMAVDDVVQLTVLDAQGNILDANLKFLDNLGYRLDEVVSRPFLEFTADARPGLLGEILSLVETGATWKGEIKNISKSGFFSWMEATFTPVLDADGELSKLIHIGFDVTERKGVEQHLANSETFSKALVASAPVGLFVTNAHGDPTFINAKWTELSAMTLISLRRNDWTNAVHPDDRDSLVSEWLSFIEGSDTFQMEFRYRRPDGQESWILASAIRLRDENGNLSGFLRVEQDLTERKLAENERLLLITNLKLAEIRLKRAVRARDEFIRICSHELKTPLSSLRLQFQMAQTRIDRRDKVVYSEGAVEKRVGLVLRQLDRMGKLIEDMLDVSRVETGQLIRRPVEYNFTSIVSESVERFSDLFESMHLDVSLDTTGEPIRMRGDPFRIEQVITNLITNAVKYGAGRPIQIKLLKKEKAVLFYVQDKGIGIAPKDIEKIFDRYERAVTSNNISGLGLGLYITKQIVTSHGGTIQVESTKNHGSRFIVELPFDPLAEPSASLLRELPDQV